MRSGGISSLQLLAQSTIQDRKRHLSSARVTGISGQSLPILGPLPTIDVLWSDLHMVHKDRSLMSYESLLLDFPHRLNSKDLSRKRRSFLMKEKSD
jgi:hypothetical protein